MQNVVDRFKEMDLKIKEQAIKDWLVHKNKKTTSKSINKQLPVDPILNQLSETQVDTLISKVQKINKNYSEWKLMKSVMERANTKISKIQQSKEEKNAILSRTLKELKQKQADLAFLEWKRQKNNKMRTVEIPTKHSKTPNQTDNIKPDDDDKPRTNHSIKIASTSIGETKIPKNPRHKMKLVRALHKKPFSYEAEHQIVKECTLSPPQLYSERERYQKDCPAFCQKYKMLVASGK